MKPEITLDVSKYTDTPIGRDALDGPKNGSDYRDNYVIPALDDYQRVKLDFTKTMGTTPSFLEEIFGGIIRKRVLGPQELKARVEVIYKYESVKRNILNYINEAAEKIK
ncbi:STAS-like domain-containing protein [Pseudomonas kurunegalensis]|uniref:STAS-like domain-containing protein n=1 Tax=Pseudomonas kurunegalensis TaxID=485880 RepID=UPI00256FE6A5|nr:STAS-like domain-containing protein [Pseudomonas kurunegalensis]WJD61540.1 STAS-like domain-containing protein [Pseudomonas kurunegalensis]